MVTKQVRTWHKTGTIVERIFVKTASDSCQFYLLTTKTTHAIMAMSKCCMPKPS